MKRFLALLLVAIMLLSACGPTVTDDSTEPVTNAPEVTDNAEVTDAPDVTDAGSETDAPAVTDAPITNPPETEPPTPVERFDHTIDVKEDTYVLNKEGSVDKSDNNFSAETCIDIKSNKGSLTRYGYLKFDISSLTGDNDFTCIDLDLTLQWRQRDAGNPEFATIEVYGCDTECDLSTVTFNNQPLIFDRVSVQNKISTEKVTTSFPITDYVRKALKNRQTEIVLYLKEATPEVPLRIKFNSKENGENIPKLSVYYGTKVDNSVYNGKTELGDPDLSKNGLDTILGQVKATTTNIKVSEDTYVEAGASSSTNFGTSKMLDFKALSGTPSNYYRVTLLKFDISEISSPSVNAANILLNCTVMEKTTVPTTVNVYGCDPSKWSENSVTYNTIPTREDLVATVVVSAQGVFGIDVTDYVNECLRYGDDTISFYLEGDQDSVRRLNFVSKESNNSAPVLSISDQSVNFTTYIQYIGENPWQVAMDSVTEWFDRWEDIKKGGDTNVETIVKNPNEYTLTVDAAKMGDTNGDNTKYTQYATRNISTLKDFTADKTESSLYDEYGGYKGGEKYEAKGFFYTKKIGDRWWTIDPLGYPFFRTAVVSVSMGNAKQKAAVLAKYGNISAWASGTSDRLMEIGFNSTGGWSSIDNLINAEQPLAQTHIIGLVSSYASSKGLNISKSGSTDLVGNVLPVFDPEFISYVDTKVKSTVSKYSDSPYIYGWMSDNELPDEANMLDNSLKFDTSDLKFIYSYATAWTFMYLKTGKTNVSLYDVTNELRQEYRAMVYDRYFSIVREALDKYAPNHQYMGCRFLANCYRDEYVQRVAGYWCDVVTLNYYGVWEADATLLANMQKWAGRPFVITEWYAKGMDVWKKDNRMTNKSGAGWTVRTQEDRGKFYQNYALQLLECKGCVGFDWFKYWDNDPEDTSTDESNRNANKGIYSNEFKEYSELVEYMEELNNQKYTLIKYFDAR